MEKEMGKEMEMEKGNVKLENLKKDELVGMIRELKEKVESLEKKRNEKSGRKEEVLELIKERGKISIDDIAKEIGISSKNVSSQLCYIKRDYGVLFGKDSKKRIYIEEEE